MLACIPGTAWAEVCDKERPYWDGTPVNMVEEVLGQLSNPFTTLVVVASIILVLRKSQLLTVLGVFLIAMYALFFVDPLFLDDAAWQAKREGCIGNQELWYALIAGSGLLGLFRLAR